MTGFPSPGYHRTTPQKFNRAKRNLVRWGLKRYLFYRLVSGGRPLDPFKFTHQVFYSSTWEEKIKTFISSLDCSDNVIWHRKRDCKKINEELATLGYYVKYHFGEGEAVSFKLNEVEGRADGWIYKNGKEIESVQIAIAFYEKEEADIDRIIMNDKDVVVGGWVGERLSLLKDRIERRISKKTNMKYQDIDTLLIGVRDWYVRRINEEYAEHKANTLMSIEPYLLNSKFKQAAIVDSDFVGKGGSLIITNKTILPINS